MAKVTTRLSDKEIKSAKPKEKEYILSDGDGLRLRVKPNGSKLWLLNYTHPIKRKRTKSGSLKQEKLPEFSSSMANASIKHITQYFIRYCCSSASYAP